MTDGEGATVPRVSKHFYTEDERGQFSKPFAAVTKFERDFAIKELFWTTSAAGVIRGMHFQLEPQQIAKLVWVSRGSVFDVVVNLHEGASFGEVSTFHLDASSGETLIVPAGFAHGFQSLVDDTIVNYAVDGLFSASHDAGIRWDSIGVSWPLPPTIISERDRTHPSLADFSPRFARSG